MSYASKTKKQVCITTIVFYSKSHCSNFAVILNGPDTQVVAPGSIVYFVCHAQGNSVNWYINGSYADQSHAAKGFNVSYTQISGNSNELGEYNNTIVVEAHPFNNNTIVSCIATANVHGQQALQEGTLIIAGT